MTETAPNEMPSAVLKDEHKIILRVVGVLSRLVERSQSGDGFERESLLRCVEFFRLFADACHHAKEEDLLFPLLESRGLPREGGPIGVMLEEHKMARALTQQMADALESGESDSVQQFHDAALNYIQLLTQHIYKEDNILFDMGDRVMTGDDQTALCAKFCEAGCRSFGGKKRDELAGIADELEEKWPE